MKISFRLFLFFLFATQWFSSSAQWVVSSISIEGNTHTKEFVIRRNLNFKTGDTISDIDSLTVITINNLMNTSLFNFVTVSHHADSANHLIRFHIRVEERWYLWPYPILEHADRNFSSFIYYRSWEKINYGFFLVKYNFRGRQEVLKAKIRKGYHEQYGFFYDKPYFKNHLNQGFGMSVAYNRQHENTIAIVDNRPVYRRYTSVSSTNLGVDLYSHWHFGIYKTLSISLGYDKRSAISPLISESPYFFGNLNTHLQYLSATFSFSIDKRDIHYYPLNGYRFSVSLQQTGSPVFNEISVSSMQVSAAFYRQKNRWSWASNLKSFATNNSTPFFLQQGMGYYGNYLRGFEYFVINGNAYYFNKNFLRFNILKKKTMFFSSLPLPKFNKIPVAIYSNIFFENGYVNDNLSVSSLSNTMQNTFLYSYGIGLDIVTYYDKVFRIDISRNNFGYTGVYLHMSAPF